MVLIPGTFSDRRAWLKQVGALSGAGQAKAVMEAIGGARLGLMAGHGHSPHIEAPAAFNKLVADFLTR